MCFSAWERVQSNTIANCFKKAGFVTGSDVATDADDVDLAALYQGPHQEFINMEDDPIGDDEELTDAEIVDEVLRPDQEQSDEEDTEEEPIPTARQGMEWIAKFRKFVEGQSDVSEEMQRALHLCTSFAAGRRERSKKQLEISSFFK
ncbi:hypothetical protein QAD02_011787 [Eretmocerus hayati]|uniref:Uncharacterized protein n=1 Tax=Eretmocerus hayati TaxID=131215 RepID=A0ACC2NZI0_9HYME|nr:hypothetical protein QAD02_011787 [Eretmocerus hayati]